jgi:hypothetical protein
MISRSHRDTERSENEFAYQFFSVAPCLRESQAAPAPGHKKSEGPKTFARVDGEKQIASFIPLSQIACGV